MKLRLKERIAWYNTIAVAIAVTIVSLVIYLVVYFTSFRQLDDSIRLESADALTNLNWKGDSIIIYQMPEWGEGEHSQAELSPIFVQVMDLKYRVLFHTTNLANDSLHFYKSTKDEVIYSDILRNQPVRQGQFPVRNEFGKKIGILLVAVSEASTSRVLKNLRLTLLITFPILLIIIFLVTSLAASRGIAPVNDLIAFASGMEDSAIQKRLPLPGSKDEIFILAKTINDLLDRIENSILQLKQFTSDASHELRTPIAAIRGTLEVMILKPREPEYYKQKIGDVIRQVDRLDNLISQLLQLTRLDSGTVTMKKETIILFPFLADIAEKWKSQMNDREMHLILKIPEYVKTTGDPVFLGLIFDNLLSNAIKYGNKAGNISIAWDPDKKCLTISDDGPGIPSNYIPHLFDRFFRTDSSRNSNVEGYGLGLAIVKKLADLHKIRITVRSEENSGTSFNLFFTL